MAPDAGCSPPSALASAGQIAWTSHPKVPQNSLAPTSASIWVSDHLPRLYDPVPEVFSERYTGVDGAVPLPVSSHECGKVLLSGLGHDDCALANPLQTRPHPGDVQRGRVCCATPIVRSDGYVFDIAPRQPGFGFVPDGAPDLLWRGPADFDWLPVRIAWLRMSSVLPLGEHLADSRDHGYRPDLHGSESAGLRRVHHDAGARAADRSAAGAPCAVRERLTNCGGWISIGKSRRRTRPLRVVSWLDVPSPSARLLVVRRADAAR